MHIDIVLRKSARKKTNTTVLTVHSPNTRSQVLACPLQSHFTHTWCSRWSVPFFNTFTYPHAQSSQESPVYPTGHSHNSTKLLFSPLAVTSPTDTIADCKLKQKNVSWKQFTFGLLWNVMPINSIRESFSLIMTANTGIQRSIYHVRRKWFLIMQKSRHEKLFKESSCISQRQ